MLKVECINASNTASLVVGMIYYAFPFPGGEAAYISRFPDKNSHFGCFQLNRFIETAKPVSTFYTTNNKPKAHQKLTDFEKGCYYFAKIKWIPDKYKPYLYVYAVSEEIIAVYDNKAFERCLGTMKTKLFEKVSDINTPESPGEIIHFPASLTYGMLMDIGFLIENTKEKLEEDNRAELLESDPEPLLRFEQLSLF